MVHYEPVKITINAPGLTKIIINVVVRYYGFLNSIIINWELLFILNF